MNRFVLAISLISLSASAKSPTINSQENFIIQYGSSSWNSSSSKINSASLFIRDSDTGKMAQVKLEETEPDSSVFSGNFRLNFGGKKKIRPQVYIPQTIEKGSDWQIRMAEKIRQGKTKRKPFLLKKEDKTIEVFDTKPQAQKAFKAYQQELAVRRNKNLKLNPLDKKPIAAKSILDATQLAAAIAKEKQMALDSSRREAERARMAQIERQKQEELLKKQRELSARAKRARKAKAEKLAQQAFALYKKSKYKEATALFEQSIALDPENKVYYYQYGVALYKTNQYNKSIVILQAANDKKVDVAEKDYFIALSLLKLNENERAFESFQKVRQLKRKVLSPSSAFYQGVIDFKRLQYEKSKEHFQHVLDTSEDPKLDQRAEDFIERIAGILYFAEQAKTKFFFNATFATQYDSNILLLSEDTLQQDTATNDSGLRLLGIGGFKYRPVFSKKHEFSTKLDLTYYYSLDDAFASADPFLIDVSTPYKYKTKAWNKAFQVEFTPTYELLYLDSANTGTRDNILKSIILEADNTLVMSPTWISNYILNFRIDDSQIAVTNADDDQSANKFELESKHTFILDKAKTKIAVGSAGVTINSADGKNNNYFRFDIGGSYITPLYSPWQITWIGGMDYYNQNYGDRADGRKDNNFKLSSTFSLPINKKMSTALTADYTKNSSSLDANKYSKFTIMTSLSANYSF